LTVIIRKKQVVKPQQEPNKPAKPKQEPKKKKKKKPIKTRFEKMQDIESGFEGIINYKVIGSKESIQVSSQNFQAYDDAHKHIMAIEPCDETIVYEIKKLYISMRKK